MSLASESAPSPTALAVEPGLQRRRRLLLILLLAAMPLIVLTLLQRRLIYHPVRETPNPAGRQGRFRLPIHPVVVPTEDGLQLNGWLVAAGEERQGDGAALVADHRILCLWLSGNGGTRGYRLPQLALIHASGAHALIIDYRGYAENPGSPSEEGLAADARAAWKYARETLRVPADRIVICGESLGGGVATRLASDLCAAQTPPAGLFLQATFSSLVDAGAYHYPWLPVRWILRDRFDSVSRIPLVTCPIVMVHGERDTIVPFDQGQHLFAAAPAMSTSGFVKKFVALPEAGHNDILSPESGSIEQWTAALGDLLLSVP